MTDQVFPPPPDIPGYLEMRYLDRGGFGAVYTAVHEHIGWHVAIKVLDQIGAADHMAQDRFRRETRLMGKLDGVPHIVAIKNADFVPIGGAPYMVMRYMAGGSLARLLERRGALTGEEVLKIGIDISDALVAARGHQIIHRDVKPENILLDEGGEAYIADFGIAITTDAQVTPFTSAQMSIEHVPPERLASGRPGTHAGDVYSLGSTLLMLLLGRPPFGRVDVGLGELARRIADDPPPAPPAGAVHQGLVTLIHGAMAKDPDARPTAATFANDLKRLAERDHLSPVPVSLAPRTEAAAASSPGGAFTSTPSMHLTETPTASQSATAYHPIPAALAPTNEPSPTGARWWPWATAMVAVVMVLVAAMALRSGGTTSTGGPTTTAAGLRLVAPVVSTVSPVEGGLQFAWEDPNEQTADPVVQRAYAAGDLTYAYRVTVDGAETDPTGFQVDETGKAFREKQLITAVTTDGSSQPVDPAAHQYCVTMLILSDQLEGEKPVLSSAPKCE